MNCSRPDLSINSEGLRPSLFPRVCLRLTSTESVMPSKDLILCQSLLLPASFFSRIGVFSNKSALHIRWPKYQSFTISTNPSSEYSGLISFRIDWLVWSVTVQGTLMSLFQHHNSKASILQHSAFFVIHLSNSYMTTGKTIALTVRTFVGKVISLSDTQLLDKMLNKWMTVLTVVLRKESPVFFFFLHIEHDLKLCELPWLFTWTQTTYKN